jgi:ABC-type polysaccharide/polyol phosphate export permease
MKSVSIFIEFLKELYRNRYMIKMMAVRNLKARYVGSLFGFLWAVINPLAQVAIYGIIFGVFFKSKPDPIYNTDSFFLYLICGIIPWQFFTQTITQSTNVIVANSNLIKKSVGFHSEILPVITLLTNLFNHLIGVGLMLLILIVFNVKITFYFFLIFIYMFLISVFSVGFSWILSSVNVYLRDVQQVVGLLMLGWFFFTPIFYSPSIIPETVLWILKLNPMFHVVVGYRYALLGEMMLPWKDLAYLAGISFVILGVGGLFFRKLKPSFAEVL